MSATIGLVSLLQNLSNQNPTQGQEPQRATQKAAASPQASPALGAAAGDQFTPSSQNVQALATALAAGLFSVAQSPFFSPAASVLLQPVATRTANQAATGAPVTTTPAPQQALAAAAQTGAVATPVPAPAQAAAAAEPTAATATSLATAQEQLQALNLALAALGLSDQDIQQLDQIASTINDYSPAAYTTRAFQLEALAQRLPAPPPATSTTNKPPAAANPNGPTAKAAAAGASATSRALVSR